MVTVLQLSDLHLAREPSTAPDGPDAGLDRALASLSAVAPDLVLLTGDVADDGSDAAYHRVRSAVDRLGAPLLATAGNHDDPATLTAAFGGEDDLRVGAWRVVALGTSVPGEIEGRVDTAALLALLGRDEGVPTVLALHHPPITMSTHPWFRTDGGGELVGLLARRSDVRIVVSGHLHQAFHVASDGVSYLGAPSTWYPIAHDGGEFVIGSGEVGAVVLELADDGSWSRRLIVS